MVLLLIFTISSSCSGSGVKLRCIPRATARPVSSEDSRFCEVGEGDIVCIISDKSRDCGGGSVAMMVAGVKETLSQKFNGRRSKPAKHTSTVPHRARHVLIYHIPDRLSQRHLTRPS